MHFILHIFIYFAFASLLSYMDYTIFNWEFWVMFGLFACVDFSSFIRGIK